MSTIESGMKKSTSKEFTTLFSIPRMTIRAEFSKSVS